MVDREIPDWCVSFFRLAVLVASARVYLMFGKKDRAMTTLEKAQQYILQVEDEMDQDISQRLKSQGKP